MDKFKYLVYFKKNKKLYVFFIMLFVLFLGLLSLSSVFCYYSNYVDNIKSSIPYTLINVYDVLEEDLDKVNNEEYVEKIVSNNFFSISVDDESFYVYSVDILDKVELDENEIIINNYFSNILNLEIGDIYTYKDNDFVIVDIVNDIEDFNCLYASNDTISNYSYHDNNNYFIILDNYNSYSKLINDYPNLNLSFYSSPLEENLSKYDTILKILNYLEIIIVIFIFFILVLVLNNIINEEKKDIAIYRTVGFSILRITGIYILKLFIICFSIYILVLFLLLIPLIFNFIYLDIYTIIKYILITMILIIFVSFLKLQIIKKKKIINLLK